MAGMETKHYEEKGRVSPEPDLSFNASHSFSFFLKGSNAII
jgi:hypothetical protein